MLTFREGEKLIMSEAVGVLEGNSPRASKTTLLRLTYHSHIGDMVILIREVSYCLAFLACIMQQSDGCRFLQALRIFNEKGKVALTVLRKLNIAVTSHFPSDGLKISLF